jgi:hypothetical protein
VSDNAMRGSVRLAVLVVIGAFGCAANPNFPECGGARLFFANAATFGMYGASNCAGRGDELRRRQDVDDCVAQGGDPAACRAAVYGTLAPRTHVRVPVTVYPR